MKKLYGLCSAVVICIGMLFIGVTSPIKAFAKETSVQTVEPRMTYIFSYSTELSISSNSV